MHVHYFYYTHQVRALIFLAIFPSPPHQVVPKSTYWTKKSRNIQVSRRVIGRGYYHVIVMGWQFFLKTLFKKNDFLHFPSHNFQNEITFSWNTPIWIILIMSRKNMFACIVHHIVLPFCQPQVFFSNFSACVSKDFVICELWSLISTNHSKLVCGCIEENNKWILF